MSAGSTNKFTDTFNSANPNVAKVTSGRTSGATTLACDNLAGWPTVSKVHFSTYQIDTNNDIVAGTQIDWEGVVSGNNVGSLVRKAGASDAGNEIGDIVEMNPTGSWGHDLYTGLTAEHNQDGTHAAVTATSVSTDTISEKTSAHGVTIDSLNIKDGQLNSNASVVPNNLIASTGTSWAWQTWSPTYTNLTVGNGTVVAKYIQIGKTVHFKFKFTWGSTSAFTTSSNIGITWPVTPTSDYLQFGAVGIASYFDTSASTVYSGVVTFDTTTNIRPFAIMSSAGLPYGQVNNSTPMTWATGDVFWLSGSYEAA